MKVVIGYDGSEQSDAVLDDLRHARLPRDTEALIISVTEGAMLPPLDSEFIEKALVSRRVVSAVAQASYALADDREFWSRSQRVRASRGPSRLLLPGNG